MCRSFLWTWACACVLLAGVPAARADEAAERERCVPRRSLDAAGAALAAGDRALARRQLERAERELAACLRSRGEPTLVRARAVARAADARPARR